MIIMKNQKILVTGGAGFIGTNLVNELRSRGHEVLAVDLYNTERDGYIRSDVRNYRQLERIFEKHTFDYVYHPAAEYCRWKGEDDYENLLQTNCIGTKTEYTGRELPEGSRMSLNNGPQMGRKKFSSPYSEILVKR